MGIHVIVMERGSFIGKKSERLVVRHRPDASADAGGQGDGRSGPGAHGPRGAARDAPPSPATSPARFPAGAVEEFALADIEQVTVDGMGVSISTDAIYECMERGIQFNLLTGTGQPYAKVSAPTLTATVATRREQVLAFLDTRGVAFAKAVVDGKLRNQAAVLKYFARHRKRADKAAYDRIREAAAAIDDVRGELNGIDGPRIDAVREQLLSIEGRAARVYWEFVRALVPEALEFAGREHRGATDPLNAMLNYGYGILYSQVWGALVLAGLEPFAGFLHVDRPGKPSLVLDCVEEFRQQVVDRPLLGAVAKGYRPKMDEGRLALEARREVARRVLDRLEAHERYEGQHCRLRVIMQRQARHLAMFLRGERDYRPFVGWW